jgi:hypothetical protein
MGFAFAFGIDFRGLCFFIRSTQELKVPTPRLFWLVFKRGDGITLFVQPATMMDYAQLKASIALEDATYQEGYELDEDGAKGAEEVNRQTAHAKAGERAT